MTAREPRVLLAADDATARGLSRLLERDGFAVAAHATSAAAAIDEAVKLRPDVCLIDTGVPGGGVRAAREICAGVPGVAVVMLAAGASEQDMIDSLRAGACGFLAIDSDPARLGSTLRCVLGGEAAIPRRLTSRLVEEVRTQGRRRRLALEAGRRIELTSREWEVVELVRGGFTTQEAAQRLFVSPVTVRRHLSSVAQKLGASDRNAAIRLIDEVSSK